LRGEIGPGEAVEGRWQLIVLQLIVLQLIILEFRHDGVLCLLSATWKLGAFDPTRFPTTTKKPAADLRRAFSIRASMIVRAVVTA
jgi:hypothetical protein